MYLELIDVLRCTVAHEESPLIAAVARRSDRDIVSGTLGCPVCHAEYPIEDGIALFTHGGGASPAQPSDRHAEPPDDLAVRCAAMLDLHDPGGIVILEGSWGLAAPGLLEMTRTLVLLVNPPSSVRRGHGIGAMRVAVTLPLASASIRGVALDDGPSARSLVTSAARALKPGGRLIAPATVELPSGVSERARDDRHWVAELDAPVSAHVRLRRGREPDAR